MSRQNTAHKRSYGWYFCGIASSLGVMLIGGGFIRSRRTLT